MVVTRLKGPIISRRSLAKLAGGLGVIASSGMGIAAEANDMVLESRLMIPMRDGVKLATDVYRPAKDGIALPGPFPVILERTPYGRTHVSRSERTAADPKPRTRAEVAEAFVSRGYVVVYQDNRGRYDSEGEFVKYLSDGDDGYDCCAWIVDQPWCNGKIGTMGLSYAAHTQGALASTNPPGVVAMFLDSGGFSNAYQGGIRQGGAFELKQVTWGYNNGLVSPFVQKDPVRLANMTAIGLRAWFARMPWKRGHSPLTPVPEYEDYVYDQWEHGNFDAYWKQVGIYAAGYYDKFPNAAMVFMSSWYDPYPRTATENYMGISKLGKGPVRLILGPWTHGDRSLTYAGDVDFGPAATLDGSLAPDHLAQRVRWFDAWMKGDKNGVAEEPAVQLFIMGGGSGTKNAAGRMDHGGNWRAEKDWPIPDARNTPYYLHPKGLLSPDMPPAGDGSVSFDYDPDHPVPTMGGNVTSGLPVMAGGAFDQVEGLKFFGSREPYIPVAVRPDVLVFETRLLEADTEVTGALEATIWVSSDRVDTDITIKLIDVYPPSVDYPSGFAMNLTDGILRLRYRNSWEEPEMLQPGVPVQVKVTTFPTSNLFKKGHRIRLDISSSNFPHFDVNPNTGAPEGTGLTRQIARNTVYLNRDRSSMVVLPIIPARS